jgi:hypothetical protein
MFLGADNDGDAAVPATPINARFNSLFVSLGGSPSPSPTSPPPPRPPPPSPPPPSPPYLAPCPAGAINLNFITSPYSGTTLGASNFYVYSTAPELAFTINVPPYAQITFQQTANDYDSTHFLRWGGSCPGTNLVTFVDDDDLTSVTWINPYSSTQAVYYIQSGYSGQSGTFTLAWAFGSAGNAHPLEREFTINVLALVMVPMDIALTVCWRMLLRLIVAGIRSPPPSPPPPSPSPPPPRPSPPPPSPPPPSPPPPRPPPPSPPPR